jgi:hypothetical protein
MANYNTSVYPGQLDTPNPSALGNVGYLLSVIEAIEKFIGTQNAVALPGIVPIGGTVIFTGEASQIPSGWFLCDGSAQSRTTYSLLFGAIGTTWGSGDGETTFNLPNLVGSFALGTKPGDTALGTLGGSTAIQQANLPEILGGAPSGGGIVQTGTAGGAYTAADITVGSDSYVYGPLNPGGEAEPYFPPYATVYYIVRAL